MLNKHKRSSRQNRKRSVLFLLAIAFQLTALAVVATATQAFAQLPGESGGYTHELFDGETGFPENLQLQYTYSEARNNGHLLSVWRDLPTRKCGCVFQAPAKGFVSFRLNAPPLIGTRG